MSKYLAVLRSMNAMTVLLLLMVIGGVEKYQGHSACNYLLWWVMYITTVRGVRTAANLEGAPQ